MTPETPRATQDVETEKTKRETWESMTPDQRFFVLETLEAALESVRNDRDVKDRAGAVIANELRKAGAELSSLRSQVETLIQKWRDAAVWEHDDMHNTQSAQTFDQCADELSAALGKNSR